MKDFEFTDSLRASVCYCFQVNKLGTLLAESCFDHQETRHYFIVADYLFDKCPVTLYLYIRYIVVTHRKDYQNGENGQQQRIHHGTKM